MGVPTAPSLLQGHWTLPAYTVGVYANLFGQQPRTRDQIRHDDVFGSSSTDWTTHINETAGPGFISIISNNPGSTYGGMFRATLDGSLVVSATCSPGDVMVGLTWESDFGDSTYGPLFFRDTFLFETRRTTGAWPFYWNCVYTLVDWD
jgi:hypothetical protein